MDYSFILLGFVGGAILIFVISRIFFKKEKIPEVNPAERVNSLISDEEIRLKVKALLESGNKIEAIKFIVKNKNTGLAEAKTLVDLVEKLKTDDILVFKNIETQNNLTEDPHLQNQVRKLIADGNKIQAIKLVVSNKKIGLKEAKDFVDAFETGSKF